jgi:hypothetical protein
MNGKLKQWPRLKPALVSHINKNRIWRFAPKRKNYAKGGPRKQVRFISVKAFFNVGSVRLKILADKKIL